MAHLFKLNESITIQAPIERCFLLSTHLAVVQAELGMHPVRGRIEGQVQDRDTIRWQGWKFGFPQHHESLIEAFDPPRFFRDRMISGRFHTFEHDHALQDLGNGVTRLADELRFTMPFGRVGELVGAMLLTPYIHNLMRRRFRRLKELAETDEWRLYLKPQ